MKKELIEIGKTYHNGKQGRSHSVRKVLGAGPEYVSYSGQEDTVCLRYLQIKGMNMGGESNITLQSFAQWAKGEVLPQAIKATESPSGAVAESEVYGNDCKNGQC